MGRVYTTMSLDGFITDPKGDALWTERLPTELDHASSHSGRAALVWEEFFPGIDAVMLGRLSYERLQHTGRWPFGETPVYVVSRTFPTGDPRVTGVFRRPEDAMAKLNQLGVQSAHVDGGRNIQGFLRRGLIDELTVQIAPVLLGGGTPLFGSLGQQVNLRVKGTDVTEFGWVRVTYAVEG